MTNNQPPAGPERTAAPAGRAPAVLEHRALPPALPMAVPMAAELASELVGHVLGELPAGCSE